MKIPLSFLKAYLSLDLPVAKIGETLTLLGIEVDRIYQEHPPFAGVVVGEILSTSPHPEAKTLQVASVSDGEKKFTAVCSASNCRAGIKTAFAKVGALLPEGRRVEKTTIRGVASSGMLCSGAELGISEDESGILELPDSVKLGDDLLSLLWDPVFELSLTPNLGHCMSALGIARELSAALQIPLQHCKYSSVKSSPLNWRVTISSPLLCPRYSCLLIEGVTVGPSPFWLKAQLESCGQKSINHVVDTANYIMLKTGQPLHAFDADLLEGATLSIDPAATAQAFLGLDGVERTIPAGALLISDRKKPVAIAGIMGGANSAVSATTTRVLLEGAYFDPLSIRNTAKGLALRTESAQRFEKGVDPLAIPEALFEAAKLIGGKSTGFLDLQHGKFVPKKISYRPARINQLLGTKLSATEMEEIFERLGLKPNEGKVTVPLYRADLCEEIDLVEEIARIYGYNNIEKRSPRPILSQIPQDPQFVFEQKIRRRLCGLGLFEFLASDLISPKLAEISQAITPSKMQFLQAAYAKSEEYSILRTSLLPGFLQSVKGNLAQKNQTLSAFEIGRIHFYQEKKSVEIPMVAILLTGKRMPPHWSHKTPEVDYFDLKGIVEELVNATFLPSEHLTFHPSRQTDIHIGDLIVGSLGEVHPALLEKFDISQRVYYAELNLLHLLAREPAHIRMKPLPQFPSSERDWTLPLDPKTLIDPILQSIRSISSSLLERAELIDLYQPEPNAQKHATFRFTYRDPFKTISFEEVELEHGKIMEQIAKLLAK